MPPRKKKTPISAEVADTQFTTIEYLSKLYRRRTSWHRSEKALTLQGKAICRSLCGGDKDVGSDLFEKIAKLAPGQRQEVIDAPDRFDTVFVEAVAELTPILEARTIFEQKRNEIEREYETLVLDLPIMQWWDKIDGVAAGSLVAIIGSTGNLWNYATVQKLWSRMGMGVMPDGRRQRNLTTASKTSLATPMAGYSARRRAIVWSIGTSIMFAQTERKQKDKETGEVVGIKKEAGEYRRLYDARRAYEEAKNERGDYAPLAAAILKGSAISKATEAYKAYSQGRLPKAHLKSRAQRYMEKELLKRLWVEWRRVMRRPPEMQT